MIIPTEADILQKENCESQQHINSSLVIRNSIQCNSARHNIISAIGLVYIQDLLPNASNHRSVDEICIGTVVLADSNKSINAQQLRQLINKQSLFNLDNKYIFVTNFGTTVTINQETAIELKQLINTENIVKFKKDFHPIRCSIIGQYLNGHMKGHMLGHVSSTYDTSLQILRNKIDEVLKDVRRDNVRLSTNYHFVHSFYYTINRNNEVALVLMDIVRNNCIFLQFEMPLDACVSGHSVSMHDKSRNSAYKYSSTDDIATASVDDQTDSVKAKNKSIQKRPTFLSRRKTIKLQKSTLKEKQKQIMISYSRQEGAEQALNLKKYLEKRGFHVYLDVHEIQMGSDWQDSLNNAIHNCKFFVPLITPMYGKTQWTNREVKMADVLNKHIIPINFLDHWPPECLAIQFATTQYIPCRPKESGLEPQDKMVDIKNWDIESIEHVTKLIFEHIVKLTKKEVKINVPNLSNSETKIAETVDATNESTHISHDDKPLIVISVHPDQFQVSMEIKEILSPQYRVWCSNVMPEPVNSHPSINEINDSGYESNLSPILEKSYHSITPETQDYARKIAENSKQRPKSVPNRETTEIALKKRDLSRVVSYNGDVSFLSSISPDKMDRLKHFQEKVLSSSLVVIMASEQYYKSRTSEQHVYYCGQRIKTIQVQCDKSPPPVWFSKLMCHDAPLSYASNNFRVDLLHKITTMLDPSCKIVEDIYETKIKYLTDCMKKNLPNLETCVYVLGSREVKDPDTIEICTAIGKELAEVVNINIVTNGFYGAGDIVAHTFVQERKADPKECNDSVVHFVPIRDNNNYREESRQNKDYAFEKVSYGQTLFMGESVKERDSVIARLMDTCILIDGGKDSVHEIEEFIWNDHFVIPVRSPGNNYDSNFPQKIFNCPNGVREEKWKVLSNPYATPVEIAKAVVNIVCDLKKAIHEHAASKNNSNIKKTLSDKPWKKRTAMRKRLNIDVKQKSISGEINEIPSEPSSPDKVLPTFQENDSLVEDTSFTAKVTKILRQIMH